MSTGAGTLRLHGPTTHPTVLHQFLVVMLVLAISIGAIVVLATFQQSVVASHARPATGVHDIDVRWIPKWGTVAEIATADVGVLVDTRWSAKSLAMEART